MHASEPSWAGPRCRRRRQHVHARGLYAADLHMPMMPSSMATRMAWVRCESLAALLPLVPTEHAIPLRAVLASPESGPDSFVFLQCMTVCSSLAGFSFPPREWRRLSLLRGQVDRRPLDASRPFPRLHRARSTESKPRGRHGGRTEYVCTCLCMYVCIYVW